MTSPKFLVLDLDNTLYPKSSGLDIAMRKRIVSYLVIRHGMSEQQAEEARAKYIKMYGLSLPGIMNDFDVDVVDYQDFIHDVDVPSFVKPNPALQSLLAGLDMKKVIYTNSSLEHTRRVLDALGVDIGLFSRVVDFRATGCKPKPEPASFEMMLEIIGACGSDCIMVDDMPKTVCVAKKQFGMKAVLVDEDGKGGCDEADWVIPSIDKLEDVLSRVF